MEAWIYSKLKENGLTSKELAKLLDLTEQSVYRKIRGKTAFSYREVVKICDILGIDNPRDYFTE